ncbi:MAG: signal peptidase I [Clostridia bacterium]|nr:signal peptidase I [Clostridia bacterium]
MNKLDPKIKNALEWIGCFIIAIVVTLLIKFYIGTPTVVKQISMYPTLQQDQRLWLNRWGRTTHTLPKRGEIITFEEPSKISYSESEIDIKNPVAKFYERTGWDWFVSEFLEMGDKRSYIKRVIALPGEHVKIENGKVYIDGEELVEDYLQPGIVTDVIGVGFSDFVVPENCVFAMGDNRNHSTDCRSFGCIPLEKIESTVAFRFWPLDKFGGIDAVK